MKIKTLIFTLLLGLTFGFLPLQVQAATKIFKLGTNPFYKVKNLQAEQVYSIVKKLEKNVKIGFKKAGAEDLFNPYMDQLQSAKLETVEIQPGETLQWMLYKKNKKVRVLKNATWAGKKPFKAYNFVLQHNDKNYEFIFPAACLNISLKGISDVPKQVAPPPLPPRAEAPVASPPAPPKDEVPVAPPSPPLKTEESKEAPVPTASVPAAPAPTAVEAPKKGFIVVDAGPLLRGDPSIFGLIRVGYMYKFTDITALTGLVGSALLLQDHTVNTVDHSAFLADVTLSIFPGKRFFVGLGAGLWATSKENKVDGILNTGIYLTDFPKQPNIAVFLEARTALDQSDNSLPYERFVIGLRMFF